jgi:Flp pilus assembly pilin Flp
MKKLLLLITIIIPYTFFCQTQIGNDIDGEAFGDDSGNSISLSGDGSILAIGASNNEGNGPQSGHVRVFQNISGIWTKIGSDIDGEAWGDKSGRSVSLSDNGNILAIGAEHNDGNGWGSGHVRIFENVSGIWTQIGNDIDGEAFGDHSGFSVSLSNDGSIVAIGAFPNSVDSTGTLSGGPVRVFQNISNVWTQIGLDIDHEATNDANGWSVSLSGDGSIVATGAHLNDGNGDESGHVRVYKNISNVWSQIGSDIDGEAIGDRSGFSVSLSNDGNIVAIGARYNDGNGVNSGHVRVYKNISNVWTQIGSDIDGEAADDNSGWSVSLSNDGSIVAIGAIYNQGNGSDSGHVRVFQNISDVWTQVGLDIDGEVAGDRCGYSVSLSSDGSVLALGAKGNDGNGDFSGHVRVYDINTVLSSDDFVSSQFELFPNPISNEFTIKLKDGSQLEKAIIYNQLGQFIKEETKYKINVSSLSKGLYLIKIKTNKGIATKKIIVE